MAVTSSGCQVFQTPPARPPGLGCSDVACNAWIPRELDKATVPMYRVEPPDVLTIDIVQQVSQSSHILQAGDTVVLTVTGTFPEEPIAGEFLIGTGGVIELGYSYGAIEIRGLTVRDAADKIADHLQKQLRDPRVCDVVAERGGSAAFNG